MLTTAKTDDISEENRETLFFYAMFFKKKQLYLFVQRLKLFANKLLKA